MNESKVPEDESSRYNIVFMDINYSSEDVTISPPKKFLEKKFLEKVLSLCSQKACYFAINVQVYSDEGMESLLKELGDLKKADSGIGLISYHEVESSRNCIVMIAKTS